MFKNYKDICDAVSLVVYCPAERMMLLCKENTGEFWIPTSKADKHCWKTTAQKMYFDLFGVDAVGRCTMIRVFKVWLPQHPLTAVFHAVYKVSIKSDVKKKAKIKANMRNKLVWFNNTEMERQRAHANFRSPEVSLYAQIALTEWTNKDDPLWQEFENLMVVELCEESTLLLPERGAGAAALTSPNLVLLQAANYNREDQSRIYREFLLLSFPAVFMSPQLFSSFMIDLGWQRPQCSSLFRAADITGRGGITFQELLLWCAVTEPITQHSGLPGEIRCRYIFRYYDSNRDGRLEYVEFKELVAAARSARMLPVDALSVAKDADVCLRQIGIQPGAPLCQMDFLRAVGELRLRGTSSMLRAPRSPVAYLADLYDPFKDRALSTASQQSKRQPLTAAQIQGTDMSGTHRAAPVSDYNMATFTVRLRREAGNELLELNNFDAYAGTASKPAWSWATPTEELAIGNLLLKLADAVRPIIQAEPRLLKLHSPVYVIGDLHGNLAALLAMEASLWPSGAALSPAKMLFLGDFVDRGPHGAELMAYLLAAKLQRPHGVLLIRGNHETRDIQKMFTFYTECINKFGELEGNKIWSAINQVFDVLPLAAVIDDREESPAVVPQVFCCHGGIPPPWVCPLVSAIDKIPCPLSRPSEQSSIAWELLWNDPIKPNKLTATLAIELAANEGFAANSRRGTGHVFDQSALDRFLLANQLSHVVRAHELHQNGFMCQLKGRLITVFSSYHYCGGTNDSGVALLESNKLRLIRIDTL